MEKINISPIKIRYDSIADIDNMLANSVQDAFLVQLSDFMDNDNDVLIGFSVLSQDNIIEKTIIIQDCVKQYIDNGCQVAYQPQLQVISPGPGF